MGTSLHAFRMCSTDIEDFIYETGGGRSRNYCSSFIYYRHCVTIQDPGCSFPMSKVARRRGHKRSKKKTLTQCSICLASYSSSTGTTKLLCQLCRKEMYENRLTEHPSSDAVWRPTTSEPYPWISSPSGTNPDNKQDFQFQELKRMMMLELFYCGICYKFCPTDQDANPSDCFHIFHSNCLKSDDAECPICRDLPELVPDVDD